MPKAEGGERKKITKLQKVPDDLMKVKEQEQDMAGRGAEEKYVGGKGKALAGVQKRKRMAGPPVRRS